MSALVMASLAAIIPPIEIIPLCWFLEMIASLMMIGGGFKEANRNIVTGLVAGSVIATPIGLALTTSLDVATSKMLALSIILALAMLQLSRVRLRCLATKPGLYASGLTAGIVTGLAAVGGMVVALYVLSQEIPARVMRASLVVFLFATGLITFIYLLLFGLVNETTLARAAMSAPLVLCGVYAGSLLFRPSLERHYRRFCLLLLSGLAVFGLLRIAGIA